MASVATQLAPDYNYPVETSSNLGTIPTVSPPDKKWQFFSGSNVSSSKIIPLEIEAAPLPRSMVETSHSAMPARELANCVNGVVRSVGDHFATVRCQLTTAIEEIEIPVDFIPEESRHYGAPITVMLDKSDGYRRIIIRPRYVSRQAWDSELDRLEAEISRL